MPPQKEKKQRDPLEIVFEKVEKQIASYTEELFRLRAAQESAIKSIESTARILQVTVENLIKERNMQAEALERLERQKISLIEEIGRLNAERVQLTAQTEAARQFASRAQKEKQRIDEEMNLLLEQKQRIDEEMNLVLEQLKERKSRAAQAEEEALAAWLELERVERLLSVKKENLARLEKEESELRNIVDEFKKEPENVGKFKIKTRLTYPTPLKIPENCKGKE